MPSSSSSASTSREPSSARLAQLDERSSKELPFGLNSWERVRIVAQNLNDRLRQVEEYKIRLAEDPQIIYCLQAQEVTAELSNWTILTESKRRKVNELSRMCGKKRLLVAELNRRIAEKEDNFSKITSYTDVGTEWLSDLQEARTERINHLNIYSKLCIARRRSIIGEIASIFRIKVQHANCASEPSTSRSTPCACKVYDSIRNIHLPHTNLLQNHNEEQLAAALGLVAHLLSVLSPVIDYPFRYPLRPGGSTSHIYSPGNNKLLPLFGMRKKIEKERLNEAITLLTRNIVQLREDSGMGSAAMHRTLYLIDEWICAANGGNMTLAYPRPFNSILSPASLILIDESMEAVDNALMELRREDELAMQRMRNEEQEEETKADEHKARETAVETAALKLRDVIGEPPDINRILLNDGKRRSSGDFNEADQRQVVDVPADSLGQSPLRNGKI